MSMPTVTEIVERGSDLLDADLGPSWPERINLDILDIENCATCMIGQLYTTPWRDGAEQNIASFGSALAHLMEPARVRGFSVWAAGFTGPEGTSWDELNAAWRERVIALRLERGLSAPNQPAREAVTA